VEVVGSWSRLAQGRKHPEPIQKMSKATRAGMDQVEEHLPRKCEGQYNTHTHKRKITKLNSASVVYILTIRTQKY
jgi:hypothetical protein